MKKTNESKHSQPRAQKSISCTVLSGTEEIINCWMTFEKKSRRYLHKSACQELSRRGSSGDAVALIEDLYNKIDANWMERKRVKAPSKENWRYEKKQGLARNNKSPEKQLERSIVELLGQNWVNEVPTASGLTSSHALKRANIDLVHRIRPACYEFIELKIVSNHPLYAAIEILRSGLLYIHARANQEQMKYSSIDNELLKADEVRLRVLAPDHYYCGYDLGWFEKKLSAGIAQFVAAAVQTSQLRGSRLKVNFKFTAFPAGFQWDRGYGKEKLQAALNGVTLAFS
jgi:hypothetical protein